MKNIRRLVALLLTLLAAMTFVPVAWAHPLGNFTINHFSGLHVTRNSIDIDFVMDMAEIPAFQEITTFDANGNGQPDASEADAYHAAKCASLQPDLSLLLNNDPLDLILASSSVTFPAGAGNLPTLRLTCEFRAPVPNNIQMTSIRFADNSYSDRIGWREIIVSANGVKLNGDYSILSVSNRLTSYPQDLLATPLNQREISLGVGLIVTTQDNSNSTSPAIPSLAGSRSDEFTQLITLQNLTLHTILFALLISFIWGAMHAMTPGHGKTIVGAYLVGSRGTAKQALYLGLTTTITHTLGVFVFGLITLFAAHFIVPEKLFPWMSFLSGLFVVGIGGNILISRFKASGMKMPLPAIKADLVPSARLPLVIHQLSGRAPAGNDANQHRYIFAASHDYEHFHSLEHTHDPGGHIHSHSAHLHLPPGADGESVTWRNLLALGVSGGILPCPSALVVLLASIALNRIGFGMILVLAFSLGLAGALTLFGLLFIYAGRFFERLPLQGKLVRIIPVFSALFIIAIGLYIITRALFDIGMPL